MIGEDELTVSVTAELDCQRSEAVEPCREPGAEYEVPLSSHNCCACVVRARDTDEPNAVEVSVGAPGLPPPITA